MIVLLAALLEPAAAATCRWEGSADDPFTHEDGRHLATELPLKNRRSWAAVDVRHATADVVPITVSFSEPGASGQLVDATLKLLLDDGSVVDLRVVEPTPPVQRFNTYFGTLDTRHVAGGELSVAQAQAVASSTITAIRHDLFSAGGITLDVAASASRKFAAALACATGP